MSTTWLADWQRARLKAVPLVAITSPDPGATLDALAKADTSAFDRAATRFVGVPVQTALLRWDIISGLTPQVTPSYSSAAGRVATNVIFDGVADSDADRASATASLPTTLELLRKAPPGPSGS